MSAEKQSGVEETAIASHGLGRRGVVVMIQVVDLTKKGDPDCHMALADVTSFRIERQWDRGRVKDVLWRGKSEEHALGFLAGVIEGLKIANA